jgi:hypothetical protein
MFGSGVWVLIPSNPAVGYSGYDNRVILNHNSFGRMGVEFGLRRSVSCQLPPQPVSSSPGFVQGLCLSFVLGKC